MVRVPEKRLEIVYGKLSKELEIILRGLCEYKGVEMVEGTLYSDHICICRLMLRNIRYRPPWDI